MHVPDETTTPPAGPVAAAPLLDTAEARDALACPLCDYSLRGLATVDHPQCPECGYRFEWPELLAARQYSHPYLFEHHPRRNVGSFIRTLIVGVRPRRFWSSLNAGHVVRPRRLMAYWLVVALLIVLTGFAGTFVANAFILYRQNTVFFRTRWLTGTPPSLFSLAFFEDVAQKTVDDASLEIYLLVAALAWPLLSLAALLVFQASMRRAKVRPGHVLRCAVYGGDVFLWTGILFLALGVLRWLEVLGRARMWDSALEARHTAFCFLLLPAVATYRLGVSYRRYLRFDRPWATVIASQAVVFLFVVTALSLVYPSFWKLMPTDVP